MTHDIDVRLRLSSSRRNLSSHVNRSALALRIKQSRIETTSLVWLRLQPDEELACLSRTNVQHWPLDHSGHDDLDRKYAPPLRPHVMQVSECNKQVLNRLMLWSHYVGLHSMWVV